MVDPAWRDRDRQSDAFAALNSRRMTSSGAGNCNTDSVWLIASRSRPRSSRRGAVGFLSVAFENGSLERWRGGVRRLGRVCQPCCKLRTLCSDVRDSHNFPKRCPRKRTNSKQSFGRHARSVDDGAFRCHIKADPRRIGASKAVFKKAAQRGIRALRWVSRYSSAVHDL